MLNIRWFAVTAGLALATLHGSAQTVISLDATSPGRTFEGLGAASAGASSRLLIDYPEPQRSEILDYLFKPGYGAGLQHLKVEIGSDVNSTDGSEPSHMRSREDHDYTRGYEWWLMREARKRNPAIILDTLPWGAPGWIGGGKYYSHDMAEYIADFLEGARKQGLEIQYTGVWNERKPEYSWVKELRKVLDEHHLATKIVCCDLYPREDMFHVADVMKADPALAKAVDAIGVHYPAEGLPGLSPDAVRESKVKVWSSEDQPNPGGGPFLSRDWTAGGRIMARRYNENYIKGRFTKTEIWSPITSYYDLLAAPNSGLMYANTPWSGHYDVQSTIWVTAHTTQFAQPGWRYMDTASGFLPQNSGSYVTLREPAEGSVNWSMVLETIAANTAQRVSLHIGRGLKATSLSVWQTNGTRTFEKVATLPVRDGVVTYEFQPDSIYTITTTTGQGKGAGVPSPAAAFPFPYKDDFESTELKRTPKYLADQDGAFEAVPCSGRAGRCIEQQITVKPIPWAPLPDPFSLAGDAHWEDYSVRVDALIPANGGATVIGRIDSSDVFKDRAALYPSGYVLRLKANGEWAVLSAQFKHPPITLASGRVAGFTTGWHRMQLRFHGAEIAAMCDGQVLANVRDTAHFAGMFGIGSDWTKVQFDNLEVSRDE